MEMNPSAPQKNAFTRMRQRISAHNQTVDKALSVALSDLEQRKELEKRAFMEKLDRKYKTMKQAKRNETIAIFEPIRQLMIDDYNNLTKLHNIPLHFDDLEDSFVPPPSMDDYNEANENKLLNKQGIIQVL